jgi:hypothetical protein
MPLWEPDQHAPDYVLKMLESLLIFHPLLVVKTPETIPTYIINKQIKYSLETSSKETCHPDCE